MQLLAETYALMKRGLGLNDDELHEVYALWNQGEPNGYLVEITSHIFSRRDETARPPIDLWIAMMFRMQKLSRRIAN